MHLARKPRTGNGHYHSKEVLTGPASTLTSIGRHRRQNHGCIKEVLALLQCELNEPVQIP